MLFVKMQDVQICYGTGSLINMAHGVGD